MECTHEKLEEMHGIIFCGICGEEVETIIGFFPEKPKGKLQKSMESYNFPDDITLEALQLYKKYYDIYKKPLRGKIGKTIVFGCFYVAWKKLKREVNEDEILEKIILNKKFGLRGLKHVVDVLGIKDGDW